MILLGEVDIKIMLDRWENLMIANTRTCALMMMMEEDFLRGVTDNWNLIKLWWFGNECVGEINEICVEIFWMIWWSLELK